MRHRLLPLSLLVFAVGIGGLTGCSLHRARPARPPVTTAEILPQGSADIAAPSINEHTTRYVPVPREANLSPTSSSSNLWASAARGFTFSNSTRPEVQRELAWYRDQKKFLREISKHAEPYLFYVLTEIRRRQLPNELALLPILESGYCPEVVSPYGAAGLWQFMGGTGNKFGLAITEWRDGRLDVMESTNAALSYLDTLHQRFDGDWLLAIAAYNAGWGNIERAISQNRRVGKSIDLWSLQVTPETQHFVARLLALVEIMKDPGHYGLVLPPIPDQAYFASVALPRPTDLRRLAQVARIPEATFKRLNPDYKTWHTGPSAQQQVLVPAYQAEVVTHLASDLPSAPLPQLDSSTRAANPTAHIVAATHSVRRGDSLWTIARRYDLHIADLEHLNNLSRNHALHIGQQIVLQPHHENAATLKPRLTIRQNKTDARIVRYRVREGDSLWTISRQFKVTIEQLLAWNKRVARVKLQPGQEIVVYPEA